MLSRRDLIKYVFNIPYVFGWNVEEEEVFDILIYCLEFSYRDGQNPQNLQSGCPDS